METVMGRGFVVQWVVIPLSIVDLWMACSAGLHTWYGAIDFGCAWLWPGFQMDYTCFFRGFVVWRLIGQNITCPCFFFNSRLEEGVLPYNRWALQALPHIGARRHPVLTATPCKHTLFFGACASCLWLIHLPFACFSTSLSCLTAKQLPLSTNISYIHIEGFPHTRLLSFHVDLR